MFFKKAAAAALLIIIASFFACRAGEVSPSPAVGLMRVRVLDGYTDAPIEGAEVVIPETERRFLTDALGKTERIELPVMRDSEYDRLLPRADGRATVIVLCPGYTPYLLLYARVTPGKEREPTVRLFPDDGTLPVFTVIEAPPAEWAEALVEKYR